MALEYTPAQAPAGPRRVASGVVIRSEGDVLSVRIDPPPTPETPIVARLASGRRVVAQWVAVDPETGLTLLRIPADSARPAVPSPQAARLGRLVVVVGNPYGLGHSVSQGSIAGLNRRLDLAPGPLGGLLQVAAPLHPGDSGALVADLRGDWIGLVRSGLARPDGDRDKARDRDKDRGRKRDGEPADDDQPTARAGYDHDLGFAIPAHDALWVADRLREHGRVDRAYLGVSMNRLTAAPAPGDPDDDLARGVPLDRVLPDTPAARAGLRAGDRLLALDGRAVRTPNDVSDHLFRTAAGARLVVDLLRGDSPTRERQRLIVTTGLAPREK